MRDLDSAIAVIEGINPIVMTVAVGALDTGDVDLRGYDGAVVALHLGAKHASDTLSGTNKITFELEHADDDGTGAAGTYAAVAAADVVGVTPASGVIYTVDAAGDCEQVFQCGYIGGKRFIKVTATPAGTIANGLPLSVELVKGYPSFKPIP